MQRNDTSSIQNRNGAILTMFELQILQAIALVLVGLFAYFTTKTERKWFTDDYFLLKKDAGHIAWSKDFESLNLLSEIERIVPKPVTNHILSPPFTNINTGIDVIAVDLPEINLGLWDNLAPVYFKGPLRMSTYNPAPTKWYKRIKLWE